MPQKSLKNRSIITSVRAKINKDSDNDEKAKEKLCKFI